MQAAGQALVVVDLRPEAVQAVAEAVAMQGTPEVRGGLEDQVPLERQQHLTVCQ